MNNVREELEQRWQTLAGEVLPGVACGVEVAEFRREGAGPAELLAPPVWLSPEQARRLGAIQDPKRRWQWLAARQLESKLRERLGADALLSVSHSEDVVMVIGAAAAGSYRIGIDLEDSRRAVDSRLSARILGEAERTAFLVPGLLGLLDAWVIKEACFKATPENTGLVISQFAIERFDRGSGRGEVQGPRGICRFLLGSVRGWRICLAVGGSKS